MFSFCTVVHLSAQWPPPRITYSLDVNEDVDLKPLRVRGELNPVLPHKESSPILLMQIRLVHSMPTPQGQIEYLSAILPSLGITVGLKKELSIHMLRLQQNCRHLVNFQVKMEIA